MRTRGSGHATDGWSRQRLAMAMLCTALAVGVCFAAALLAGTLTTVGPTGASVAVPVGITGTGFHATAANNEVTFAAGGIARTALGEVITTLDATRRRLTVRVPAGLPVGRATLTVRNTVTGEQSTGFGLDITEIHLIGNTSSVRGAAGVQVRIAGSPNVQFVAGQTSVIFGAGVAVSATTVESATSVVATIDVAASAAIGPRDITVKTSQQTSLLPGGFQITQAPPANRPPVAVANGPYTGTTGSNITFSSAGSVDPDGDPLTFSWTFGDGATSTEANPQHSFQSAGVFPVRLTVADGKGGQAMASADATVVAPAVTLTGISLSPEFLRFSVVGADRPLSVIGQMSDGSSVDLTATTDTTYESTNAFVAAVTAVGVAHSVGNGSATIAARHGQFTDTVAVTVEAGIALETLDLTAPATVLRSIGASVAVTLRGQFSDGETRDLTTAEGTVYDSGDPHVASVDASGRVTAVAVGDVIITAHHDEASATIAFHVAISTGTGLLRGQVLDDSRGLPLAGATVALLADGGGSLPVPATTTADERGRFELAGRAGDAVVAVTKPGFTVVERRAAIPSGGAITLLDARLTPIDTFPNAMTSAFGGEAHDRSGLFRLVIPPGGIAAAADFTLTPISAQGLEGRLPLGGRPSSRSTSRPEISLSGQADR